MVQDHAATVCPGCGAPLEEKDPAADAAIPGVTVVDPEIKLAERRAARGLQRAKMAGNGAMFGLTGMLLSKALSSVQAGSTNADPDLFDDATAGLAPTGLAPGGIVMATGAAPVPAPRPANLPKGAMPAIYVPVGIPPAGSPAVPPEASTVDVSEDAPATPPDGALPAPDPWRDLPSPSMAEQIAGTEWDPWAGSIADPPPEPNVLSTPSGPPPGDPWAVEGGSWSTDPKPPEEDPSK